MVTWVLEPIPAVIGQLEQESENTLDRSSVYYTADIPFTPMGNLGLPVNLRKPNYTSTDMQSIHRKAFGRPVDSNLDSSSWKAELSIWLFSSLFHHRAGHHGDIFVISVWTFKTYRMCTQVPISIFQWGSVGNRDNIAGSTFFHLKQCSLIMYDLDVWLNSLPFSHLQYL